MPGEIKFSYRAVHDVVIAQVNWQLESEADVLAWYNVYRDYFTSRYDRKVDLILELSRFKVNPKIATFFGEYRARVLREFTLGSYRVNQAPRERTFMYTSSALHGAPANHFTSMEAAFEALRSDRAKRQSEPAAARPG